MIKVTTPGTEPDAALLRAMFAARKAVFIDLLRWDLPVLAGQYEMDQFDDEHARYLILSEGGGHVASARLLPTTREGILSGLYPMLCDGPMPCAPDTYEITRFCLDRSLNTPERRDARNALVHALATHAINAGISRYCAVAGFGWFKQIEQFGWSCRSLGQPVRTGGRELIGLEIQITADTPRLLEAAGMRSNDSDHPSPAIPNPGSAAPEERH
jgi:N-acyl-L-homoserine lactone synthetase